MEPPSAPTVHDLVKVEEIRKNEVGIGGEIEEEIERRGRRQKT